MPGKRGACACPAARPGGPSVAWPCWAAHLLRGECQQQGEAARFIQAGRSLSTSPGSAYVHDGGGSPGARVASKGRERQVLPGSERRRAVTRLDGGGSGHAGNGCRRAGRSGRTQSTRTPPPRAPRLQRGPRDGGPGRPRGRRAWCRRSTEQPELEEDVGEAGSELSWQGPACRAACWAIASAGCGAVGGLCARAGPRLPWEEWPSPAWWPSPLHVGRPAVARRCARTGAPSDMVSKRRLEETCRHDRASSRRSSESLRSGSSWRCAARYRARPRVAPSLRSPLLVSA